MSDVLTFYARSNCFSLAKTLHITISKLMQPHPSCPEMPATLRKSCPLLNLSHWTFPSHAPYEENKAPPLNAPALFPSRRSSSWPGPAAAHRRAAGCVEAAAGPPGDCAGCTTTPGKENTINSNNQTKSHSTRPRPLKATPTFICFISSNICSGGRLATALVMASRALSGDTGFPWSEGWQWPEIKEGKHHIIYSN